MRLIVISAIVALFVVNCSEDKLQGSIEVKVIKPIGARCHYTIAPTRIETLYSLTNVFGALGKVVISSTKIDDLNSIWESSAVTAQFAKNSSYYVPLDMDSLFSISIYYAMEETHFLFSRLQPEANILSNFPGFGERTWFIYNAIMEEDSEKITDNAGYYPAYSTNDKSLAPNNIFFFFPIETSRELPLGLNSGIVAHEYSHLVMEHLFTRRVDLDGLSISSSSQMVFASLDEGIADYFGFLITSDPAFFLCSYPTENRDLSVPKKFTNYILEKLYTDHNFDVHEGGAVFASINYLIGEAIHSHERNGSYLIKLILNLQNCAKRDGSVLTIDISTIAQCHAGVANGSDQSTIQSIYRNYIESYGGSL